MVEVAGVEPASESTLTGLSPGADDYCGGLTPPVPLEDGKPSRRTSQVSFIMCGTGKAYRTHIYRYTTPFPARGPSGSDGCLYLGSNSNSVVVI